MTSSTEMERREQYRTPLSTRRIFKTKGGKNRKKNVLKTHLNTLLMFAYLWCMSYNTKMRMANAPLSHFRILFFFVRNPISGFFFFSVRNPSFCQQKRIFFGRSHKFEIVRGVEQHQKNDKYQEEPCESRQKHSQEETYEEEETHEKE